MSKKVQISRHKINPNKRNSLKTSHKKKKKRTQFNFENFNL